MDDTHRTQDDPPSLEEAVTALEGMDPADSPEAAERLADRLQTALDESEEAGD